MSICRSRYSFRGCGTLSLPNFAAHGSLSRVILRQTGYTNKNVSVRHIFETNREAKLGRGAPWPTADAVSGLGKKIYSFHSLFFGMKHGDKKENSEWNGKDAAHF